MELLRQIATDLEYLGEDLVERMVEETTLLPAAARRAGVFSATLLRPDRGGTLVGGCANLTLAMRTGRARYSIEAASARAGGDLVCQQGHGFGAGYGNPRNGSTRISRTLAPRDLRRDPRCC